MCTVTVYRHDGNAVITMNRDERRERHEGDLFCDPAFVFPVDLESGGTWCGVNTCGLAMTLLNRYHEDQNLGSVSRGGIIPAALKATSLEGVSEIVHSLDLTVYNPFTLLVMSRLLTVEFIWNSKLLSKSTVESHPWSLASSSSWEADRVLALRQNRFVKWAASSRASAGVIPDLHLNQNDWNKTDSILMERPASHTKSISQISLNAQSIGFSYYNQASLGSLQINPAMSAPVFVELTIAP